jgi:hypothetical protein
VAVSWEHIIWYFPTRLKKISPTQNPHQIPNRANWWLVLAPQQLHITNARRKGYLELRNRDERAQSQHLATRYWLLFWDTDGECRFAGAIVKIIFSLPTFREYVSSFSCSPIPSGTILVPCLRTATHQFRFYFDVQVEMTLHSLLFGIWK